MEKIVTIRKKLSTEEEESYHYCRRLSTREENFYRERQFQVVKSCSQGFMHTNEYN